ncbi:hypothetical protein CK203_064711 [Vitis vinifera]|uniref:C-JID domain-containing protein n=1 Tax=Vitis vinifera TaxID=29760 RepID=A0A438G7C0_VITVI|nr:hypothetical protein CK203_064711 [Vitis vinifera]
MLEGIPELPLSLKRIEAWLHKPGNFIEFIKSTMVFSSPVVQVSKISEAQPKSAGSMIPGSSGIPEWVLHQEMEREVRIELPMNCCASCGFGCQCDYYRNINSGASDELWVTYYPKISIPGKYHSNQFKHIQASFSARTVSDIKSCGIHLIYSQDHQQRNTPLLDSLGTQADDLPDNFQDNTESVAEDTNGNVKRRRTNPSRGHPIKE